MTFMESINKFSKLILYFCFTSGLLWLGSYITRLTVAYQLFQGNYFNLKSYITNLNLSGILTALNGEILLEVSLYILFIITFLIFLISSKISLKQNGWLFIITLIVFVTFPFELYLITIDYKILTEVYSAGFNANQVLNLYIERFKVLGSFPIIEVLCYFAVIFLILFKPFKMKEKISYEN